MPKTGGQHKTARQAIQLPKDWFLLAKKMASTKQQPMLWYLISLIGTAAKKEGIENPPYPWEGE